MKSNFGDEGFEEDFPPEFPFWYASTSGPLKINRQIPIADLSLRTDIAIPDRKHNLVSPIGINKHGWKDSYRDQDSCLHYFISTTQSEEILDQYISNIIQKFLNEPGPINAQLSETKKSDVHVPLKTSGSMNLEEYLFNLKTNLIDKSTKTGAPQMMGHMTTALPFFHRPLARLLTALNQNVVKTETASTFTNLERQTIAMLHSSFFNQNTAFYSKYASSFEHCLGVFCSGGTIANITAMWIARNKALKATNGFNGLAKEGLLAAMNFYGYKGSVIIGSKLMHYSFKKAADILGMGENGLELIPVDSSFRINTTILQEKIKEYKARNFLIIAVIGICGATETGSIDPLNVMQQICNEHKIHFHVDAAWGGPMIFSYEHSYKLRGIQYADSITVDGHKQLYTPMGLGVLLLKSPTSALHIMKTANYVIRQDSPDMGKFTLEGSRPANALYLNASLVLLGRDGLSVLITRSCTLIRQLYHRLLNHPNKCFQPICEPQSNILLYRYIPSELCNKTKFTKEDEKCLNEYVIKIQTKQLNSNYFVSRTKIELDGWIDCFRVVIANPLTQWEDIESMLVQQIEIAKAVEAETKETKRQSRLLKSIGANEFWPGWPYDL